MSGDLANVEQKAEGEIGFNLDSLLNNCSTYSDEELYKAFAAEVQNPIPLIEESTIFESTQEYPDLAALDLNGLGFLQDENSFPDLNQLQDTQTEFSSLEIEAPEKNTKRPAATPKRARSSKKPKIEVKQETNLVYVDHPSSYRKVEDKHSKRLIANKKSAQASRERKKQLKVLLEHKVKELTAENSELGTKITQLQTENKVLKGEFVHLQRMISESPILSKMMARSNMESLPELDPKMRKELPPALTNAACFYLMVMLYSFGQHFTSVQMAPINNSLPLTYTPSSIAV